MVSMTRPTAPFTERIQQQKTDKYVVLGQTIGKTVAGLIGIFNPFFTIFLWVYNFWLIETWMPELSGQFHAIFPSIPIPMLGFGLAMLRLMVVAATPVNNSSRR